MIVPSGGLSRRTSGMGQKLPYLVGPHCVGLAPDSGQTPKVRERPLCANSRHHYHSVSRPIAAGSLQFAASLRHSGRRLALGYSARSVSEAHKGRPAARKPSKSRFSSCGRAKSQS